LAGRVARTEEAKNACRVSVRNPVGKRQLRRSGCRWNFITWYYSES